MEVGFWLNMYNPIEKPAEYISQSSRVTIARLIEPTEGDSSNLDRTMLIDEENEEKPKDNE